MPDAGRNHLVFLSLSPSDHPRIRTSMPFLLRAVLWMLPFALFAASPFATAWTLKDAIKSGNVPVINALVEWDSVRVSLRKSMTALALDRPMDFQVPPDVSLAQSSNAPKAGLWQRVKGYFGTAAVERLINRYANAEGLPTLFTYGQAYKRYVKGIDEPPKTMANLPERIKEFWSRLRHVEFVTPTAFEIEMADKTDPTRRFTGLFQFRDMRWKLTQLYVHTAANPLGRMAALR
ncbi:MAG: hypothetical protein B7Z29_09080 [Hyphomicrobium sp. 12-62-95]|nr:MAG: hypothetical protein B7Z29_09080 [Hyphomicrobium sp. 12-62-95]